MAATAITPLRKPATTGRVLLVDDELMLLRALTRYLEADGHQVCHAHNGLEALAKLAETRFDVIVTDITMPHMSGVELLRSIRRAGDDVPVVLMTGRPSVGSSVSALENGALRYLIKPFQPKVLLDLVAQAVNTSRIGRLKQHALELVQIREKEETDLDTLRRNFARAMEKLWIAYQPIVCVPEQRTFAFEALMRSDEPSLPHPGAILEAAQKLGELGKLGRIIRERIAPSVSSAPSECVFVNVHPLDLLDEQLYSESAPLSRVADRVVLEITERAGLEEVKDFASRIEALRNLGYCIALDDLGAGYSGLTTFAELEPDIVKFDMALVKGIHDHAKKLALVESMTRTFGEMGIRVVAEGIEVAEERDALLRAGCDLLQGYYYARPGRPFPTVRW